MNKKLCLCAFIIGTTGLLAQSKDTIQLQEIVVTDTKFPQQKEQSGRLIEKITAPTLQKYQNQSVATVLNTVAGLEMNGSYGSAGKNVSYFIRGGRNRQALILIDGVPVSDASGIANDFDLRLLSVNEIESIEVMKGSASTLYGSGAATAVINIIRKKAASKVLSGNVYTLLGTQNTTDAHSGTLRNVTDGFSLNGSWKKWSYNTSVNHQYSNGISETMGNEWDPFNKLNLYQNVGYAFSKKVKLNGFVSLDKINNRFDAPFDNLTNTDIAENKSENKQFRYGFISQFKYKNGMCIAQGTYTYNTRIYDQLNTWSNTTEAWKYYSQNVVSEVYNKWNINDKIYSVTGVQHQYLAMENETPYGNLYQPDTRYYHLDPYTSLNITFANVLSVNTGVRLNYHSKYGSNWVFHVNPYKQFKNVKVFASYNTAYIAPSLYQLYSPYGNIDLQPERNRTVELGFETKLKKFIGSVTSYYREESNTIGFVSKYANIEGKNWVKGIETSVAYTGIKNTTIRANYSFVQPQEPLQRLIPKHKANVEVAYNWKNTQVLATYQYVNQRMDSYFDSSLFKNVDTQLSAYRLCNFKIQQQLTPIITLSGGVTNVFNELYTEVIGYNTLGRNYQVGLSLQF